MPNDESSRRSFLNVCNLHNIDTCNWFMGRHPIDVVAYGGAAWRPREEEYGNIYDHLAADFVYPNGVHMSSRCRQYQGSEMAQNVSERIVGSGARDCRLTPTCGSISTW
jgi:myo-inositol 2-dehydrogenase/D-chiro-inositol 1-dehydrogenase